MRAENSFIPVDGVGETTERNLWERGITHWDNFEPDAVGPTTAECIDSFIDVARDHLERDDARFFGQVFPDSEHWRLYETFREDACFLDIETTGLSQRRDDVTVVGLHQGGESEALVRGRGLTRESLQRSLADAKILITFNGKRFDVPFLESSFDMSIDLPHVDLMYPCRRLDLTGGLKSIEREVGIDRDRPDLTGRDAVRLWHRYERGDDGALETLVSYNLDDTANLAHLMDHVGERLHESVFPAQAAD